MNVHGDNIVHIDHFGAACFGVAQESLQLKEASGSHKFQDIAMGDIKSIAAAAVEELHDKLKDVIPYVIDLDSGRAGGITQLGAEHALETWRCSDQYDLVTIKDFAFDAVSR